MTVKRPPVLSVTQLNTYARTILEQDPVLKNVFVAGEISNFKNHIKTGHFYMTLKDENAAIKAVMFRSYASRPVSYTHLRAPETGSYPGGRVPRGRKNLIPNKDAQQ